MITSIRHEINAAFTPEKYAAFLADLSKEFDMPVNFRVAETPIFVPKQLGNDLLAACEDIIDFVKRPDFKTLTAKAINPRWNVPNEDEHTLFLCIDFAVTQAADGSYLPQLIEFQGFPSLFAYKYGLQKVYRQHYAIPEGFSPFFNGMDGAAYLERMKNAFLNGHAPENVVLLEVEPWKQNTSIDFAATEQLFGIKAICLTDVEKDGRELYYQLDGKRTRITRIYNRIIFDELEQREDILERSQFKMTDDVDVEWAGHPNWYSRISKFCMPFLKSKYVPESRLLSDFNGNFPSDLENYVLKPLYSFSGSGVKFHVNADDLAAIMLSDYDNWMLQRKVQYEPVIEASDEGKVKLEIRMLYVWEKNNERPSAVINIARLSRGEMIGVKYNKDKTWVGGGICFFEQ